MMSPMTHAGEKKSKTSIADRRLERGVWSVFCLDQSAGMKT